MDFLQLSDFMNNFNKGNCLVAGDLNVRIGEERVLPDPFINENEFIFVNRNSKDTKIDIRGKKFLDFCENFDLIVLNGRTKSDRNGEFTFVGGMGKSVNDIACISGEWIPILKDFEVLGKPFSDHSPLSMSIEYKSEANIEKLALLPKLIWKPDLKNQYNINLEKEFSKRRNVGKSTEEQMKNIVECIVAASAKKRNPNDKKIFKTAWFDNECFIARKNVFRLLNLFRKDESDSTRLSYLQENSKYKDLCRDKERRYLEKLGRKISLIRDGKKFWETVKELNGSKLKFSNRIAMNNLVQHFQCLLNPSLSSPSIEYAEPFNEDDLLDTSITLEELNEVLKNLKDNKAAGVDRIPYEFYKFTDESTKNKFLSLFNTIFDTGEIPKSFRETLIFPIHKKGDADNPANYRGISFGNSVGKIYSALLLNRLAKWGEEKRILSEFQAGFRYGYSTVDQIFNLTSIIEIYFSKRKPVYTMFVDFKAAFDSIDRNALFFKLISLGISTKFVRAIKALYSNTMSAIWGGARISEWFETKMGVKQGCQLSPYLFILFLNDLCSVLGEGVRIEGVSINLLLYADDLVLLADSPSTLQKLINRLSQYCKLWNLTINLEKSKVMVFKKGGKRAASEKWNLDGQEIEVVSEYKYLGYIITPQLSTTKHLQSRLALAKCSVNSTWKNFMNRKDVVSSAKYKIFSAVTKSIMCYAAQVWGYKQSEIVEKLLRFFLKKLFKLPQFTPNYMLHVETGLSSLFIFTLKLHFNYILKILDLPDDRLPKMLAHSVIRSKLSWAKAWEYYNEKYAGCKLDINLSDLSVLRETLYKLVNLIDEKQRIEYINQGKQSQTRDLYSKLELNLCENNYFSDSHSISMISTIFRARGELLNLGYIPHVKEDICSMCNMGVRENAFHFLAECPTFKAYRKTFFGKYSLSLEELLIFLNGRDWSALHFYVCTANSLRMRIIHEDF